MSKSTKIIVAVVVIILVVAAIYFVAKSKIIHGIGGGDTGPGNSINVVSLGADSGGKSDSSKAVLAAWKAACKSSGKSTIFFPEGRYLISSPVAISGKECKAGEVNFDVNKATLTGPPDYKDLGDSKDWFSFDAVGGVSITGGIFDAQAHGLYECKKSGDGCPTGATSLRFSDSSNIELNGVKSVNSQLYHIVFHGCKRVKVEGVKITAPGDSPNTDGIHVQLSSDVTILHSDVGTGDDCVSVGPGTTKLWIENMACGPGHGISIGSLGKERDEEGVEDVTVKTVTFTGTTNGVRIKSWGRKSDGFVKKVLFQDIKIDNAENPIIIDQNYCPHHEDCPGKDSGIQISDVTYQSIHGSSASEIGVKLDCSSDSPCENIKVEDVDLSYHGEAAQSSCDNVEGLTPNIC